MNIAHYFETSDSASRLTKHTALNRESEANPVMATPLAALATVGVAGFVGGYVAGAIR